MEYEYVGAPWQQGPWFGRVGNGGFSFRKRSAMLRCIQEVSNYNCSWFVAYDSNVHDTTYADHSRSYLFAILKSNLLQRPIGSTSPWGHVEEEDAYFSVTCEDIMKRPSYDKAK